MEKKLYPLKFTPILKDKIWGGNKLKNILNKTDASDKTGESWEISGVKGNVSVVENGFLKGNNLEELIEVYMGDLVGDKTYDKFGLEFPLLIKYIDANDNLSIQVHPHDALAFERHQSYGKTEMWYIMETEKDASLIVGFNKEISREDYIQHVQDKKIESILNREKIEPGDVYFMPAGRIHAIGAGTLLAEIQQTSDITYRIYDFERKDEHGNTRELHTDLAVDAIDFTYHDNYRTEYENKPNKPNNIVSCPYFITNMLNLDKPIKRDYFQLDSFVILMCMEGDVRVKYYTDQLNVNRGDTILIPAELEEITIEPTGPSKILEVYLS